MSWGSTDEEELTVRKARRPPNRGNSMCKGTGAFRGPDSCVTATAAVNAREGGVGDGDKQDYEGTETILPAMNRGRS